MSFPWAINTNTRTYRKRDKVRFASWRRRRHSLRLFVFLALSGVTSVLDVPVTRAEPPPTALPQGGTVASGTALIQSTANAMTIEQHSQKAILNWQSFNIGRDASVTFRQPDASSSALNRIHQGSPSEIFGRLSANGQIYLLNQNGIIFGQGAVVDTNSLVASTLDISDEVFNTIGLTNAINQGKAAFEGAGAMGLIKVESGAKLKSAEGGRIMIFAPQVENAGDINTPGGQAILAASHDEVYLANSDDENLRGLLVEVKTGGDVSNVGKIIAERGNVSLLGLAVNQSGVVRATTSVNLNGSIRLVAQDQASVTVAGGVGKALATRTGTLTLGPNSLTEVAPDDPARTAADAQAQPLSQITLVGDAVTLKSGARIVAPAGDVRIVATDKPLAPGPLTNPSGTSEFVMEAGSRIDVSGLDSAVLPMERNVIAVELRGNELRDAPLQRNGPLYGETVYVDARQGTPLADVSGQIAAIQRPLAERLAGGGTVSIATDGTVETQANSVIDVSGGSIRYRDGYVNTTQLVSQGKVIDIGEADPNRPYDGISGVYKVVHRKWGVNETFGSQGAGRFESGYVEGKDAGTVTFNAREPDKKLIGTLLAEITAGRYQRLPQQPIPEQQGFFARAYDQVPLGGQLVFGAPGLDASWVDDFTLQSLSALGADSMNRVRVYADGKITIPGQAKLAFAPGGELTLVASSVDVNGDIAAPGGNVKIEATGRSTLLSDGSSGKLGASASIDVSGQWVNDGAALNPGTAPQDPVFIDGGQVAIEAAGDFALEAGSLIDAGGGVQAQRDGGLEYGRGGTITLTGKPATANAAGESSTLRLDGELRAYAFEQGGTLNLTAAGFRIEDGPGEAPARTGADDTIYLEPGFFERGGFSAYNLKSTHTGISVAQNTDVRPRAMNRVLGPSFNLQPTGTPLNQVTSPAFLPGYQQQPVSLELALERATGVPNTVRVEMESGSAIHATPGANVSLKSDTQLVVDGAIVTPGGDIRLALTAPSETSNEKGFDRTQAIWLGPNAQLLAKADFQSVPDVTGRGQRLATVRDGGTVTVAAERGYLLADTGSVIDVSGASQTLDIALRGQVQPTLVNATAGTIDLLAAEGMVLNGELRGAPGEGPGAAAGALGVTLDPAGRLKTQLTDNSLPAYPTGLREIVLTSSAANTPAAGTPVPDSLNGRVRLDPETVRRGGFDRLTLRSRSANPSDPTAARIRLEGDVELEVARRLVLDAPVLQSDGGRSTLSAAYVAMGSTSNFAVTPVLPEIGTAELEVRAEHVDIIGTLALRGFGSAPGAPAGTAPVRIDSEGDIRFIGGAQTEKRGESIYSFGRLNAATDLDLRADQVYAATATDFTVSVTGEDGRIRILPGGASRAPLSAVSRLTLAVDRIEQHGTLRAPFGQIELHAGKELVLGNGSITSVSGAGLLTPFGVTEFGQDWVYPLLDNFKGVYLAAPAKGIELDAPRIALAPGSVVDVTGGGDLLAREHLPGPGGSSDILDNTLPDGTPNTAFAIVPTQTSLYGSYDPFLSHGSPIQTGDTIHLADGGPLAAGEYAILPAGYALLPGAYLVTPLPKTASPLPGTVVRQYDGSAIVAGQRGLAGTDTRASLWSAFLVENGTQLRNRAEYLESRADSFLAAGAARLNRDAGQLVIDAGTALTLGGTLAGNTTGGRGSEVDILADNLAVVTSRSNVGERVELLASELNDLNADSLLLGATREHQDADLALDVQATHVAVEDGASLSAPEVMLAAKAQVTVAGGATITASDGDRVSAPASIRLAGDSAFARVSSADQVRVDRASGLGTSGKLDIAAGAVLDASRSITLDASRDTVVDGDLVTHGGSLSLAAGRVSLGDTQGVTGGLVLSNERLGVLDARDLALKSRGSIDFYGDVSLANLNRVAFDAAGLGGNGITGQGVSISADTISLSNRSGADFPAAPAPSGSGALNLAAREVALGEGDFAVRGFGKTTISATEQVIAKPETDTKVQLHVAGDLTLQASRLTTSKGADASIDTRDASNAVIGKMTLTAPAATAEELAPGELGAKLELTATQIDLGTRIESRSGIVSLRATTADVNIADNASIDVSGRDLHFADHTVGSPGGMVSLAADQGNVTIGAATLDVSGAASGGDAGTLSVSAPNGAVQIGANAQLAAAHADDARAGSFTLDSQAVTNGFSALIAALNDNQAGFTDSLRFRLRAGDVAIDRDVLAHDLRVAADAGKIDVTGQINADGVEGGRVALYARDDVTLGDTAHVVARATGKNEKGDSTGKDEKGGSVTLASVSGRLDLQAGAIIDVVGMNADGTSANTGTVHLRAEREATGDGIKINSIAANITGAGRVDIEAYKIYTDANAPGSIDALVSTIRGETNSFMADANIARIKTTLGIDSSAPENSRFHLLPGVEIRGSASLTLNTRWDLLDWRYGAAADQPVEPGVLTIRAGENLNFNASLSDGVKSVSALDGALAPRETVQHGPSWSYRLVAGADMTSADPLAVGMVPGRGNVTLANDQVVRTGTGNIDVAAANNLSLGNSKSAVQTVGENRGTGLLPMYLGEFSPEVTKELIYGGDFLGNGGDIRITTGGDVIGKKSDLFLNDWLARAGGNLFAFGVDLPGTWAIDLENFRANIGALGGGDVTLKTGGDIQDLSVAIPTTAMPVGGTGTEPQIAGGGDLKIEAQGDIGGGLLYLAQGRAEIRSDGSVGSAEGKSVFPVLALADGEYAVSARKDLSIETVVNPTALKKDVNLQGPAELPGQAGDSAFFTYASDSAVRLLAIAGDVLMRGDRAELGVGRAELVTLDNHYYPGTLSAHSLEGDIQFGESIVLLPAARGDLELLAEGNIASLDAVPGTITTRTIKLSDANPALLPDVMNPALDIDDTVRGIIFESHAPVPLHQDDDRPARIVARTGTVGTLPGSQASLIFDIPKQTHVSAGEDVRNLRLQLQHVDEGDISVIEAGGSVLFPTERSPERGILTASASEQRRFEIAGPGQLHVIAGKDVDLGTSNGIVSIGDQKNPALADGGADITVMAGQKPGPDYENFIQAYLADSDVYHEKLARYLEGLPEATGTDVAAFRDLSPVQQRKFILEILFDELRETGVAAVESKNYERGFDAIQALFPAEHYDGDVKSFLSKIYTTDGGTINLVVPGGLVNAGVAGASGIEKSADDLGIAVTREGDINAFVHGDFLVNQSRVFALDGGDILMWSSVGDIDAGKGAKTALSIPAPTTTTDPVTGNTIVEFPPAISGSGIRAAVSTPGREPGEVILVAPAGVINAGDAGIGSAGNLTIAATAVIGADNIQVGGASVGVPTDAGGLGAGLAGVGDIAATAGKLSEDVSRGLAEQKQATEGLLSVEVVGFGDGAGEVVNLRKQSSQDKDKKDKDMQCDPAGSVECPATRN
jgi:filamentous hemagglutinin